MPWVINNGSDSESPGEKWQCFNCGFNNRSHNQVCGGTGPMGCKAPKLMAEMMSYQAMASYGGPYGPMRSMKMSKISPPSPYAGGSWVCVCGFTNRPQNSVCGGTGPIGCKMPRPSEGHSGPPMEALMQMAMWAPPCKGKGGPMDAQFCKGKGSMGMGFRSDGCMGMGFRSDGSMSMGCRPDRGICMKATTDFSAATEWVCQCGFRNRAQNRVCGGTGSMGCKAERPGTSVISPKIKVEPAASFDWLCTGCGFVNKPSNSICGGKGPLGCKASKPDDDELETGSQYQSQVRARQGSSRERTREKKFDWLCECGFINKPHNTVCGGKGPMGCKLPKPDEL